MAILLPVDELADEVFRLVEYDQGMGFVSDGLGACKTHPEFFGTVRGHLQYTKRAAEKLRRFLTKYDQL